MMRRYGRMVAAALPLRSGSVGSSQWTLARCSSTEGGKGKGTELRYTYETPPDFEPVMMRYFNDGVDSEFKDEVREYVKSNPNAFLYSNKDRDRAHQHNMAKLKFLCKKGLFSVAQVNTTPRTFYSIYEVLATLDPQLSISLAHHLSLFGAIIAVHGQAHHHQWVLGDIDRLQTVGCCAINEVLADTPPVGTTAFYFPQHDSFVIDSPSGGDNKFAVVNALNAEWALVVAKVDVNGDVFPPQLFLLRLRNSAGELLPGVHISSVGDTSGLDGCGTAVIRFEKYRADREAMLMSHWKIDDSRKMVQIEGAKDPFETLAVFHRLSAASIALGKAKRMTADLVNFASNKMTIGPMNKRDYPLLGYQHIQAQLSRAVSKVYVYNAIFHRVTSIFCKPHEKYNDEDSVQLVLIASKLVDLCQELAVLGSNVLGQHACVEGNNLAQTSALSSFLYEGWDRHHLVRAVSSAIVEKQMGSQSKFSGFISWLPEGALRRFFGSPLFTPRSLELGRYQVLFSNRQVHLRSKLGLVLMKEKSYGPQDEFYYLNCEEYRSQLGVVESYMDVMSIDTMLQEASACHDPQNKRMLRDLAWHHAVARMEDDVAWFMEEGWLSTRFGRSLHKHLDLMTNNIARQSVPLMGALGIPPEFRTSPIANDLAEIYGLGAPPVVRETPKEEEE